MKTSKEYLIRQLDDTRQSTVEAIKRISQETGINHSYCKYVLYAKRLGYNSASDYKNNCAQKRGYKSAAEAQHFFAERKEKGEDYTLEMHRQRKGQKNALQSIEHYVTENELTQNQAEATRTEMDKEIISRYNEKEGLFENARRIADETGLKFSTCANYLMAYRGGFSIRGYYDLLARKRGFEDDHEKDLFNKLKAENPLITLEEAREIIADKLGFDSPESYNLYLKDKGRFFQRSKDSPERRKQKIFEYSKVQQIDLREVEGAAVSNEQGALDSLDREDFWKFLEKTFSESRISGAKKNYLYVLQQRYAEGKNLEEIGKELGVCGERIRQIIFKALGVLRKPRVLRKLEEYCR